MSCYKDIYGLYHHKPVRADLVPTSNNGWIYTSMAHNLGLPIHRPRLKETFYNCVDERGELTRLPGLENPPISRDEIIGMASLGMLGRGSVYLKDWRFHRLDLDYPLTEQVEAVLSLRGKHRNYVWEEKVYAAYPLVFKLGPHDVYYLKRLWHQKTSRLEQVLFYTHVAMTMLRRDSAELTMLWTQLKDLRMNLLASLINYRKQFKKVFPSDHPFNIDK